MRRLLQFACTPLLATVLLGHPFSASWQDVPPAQWSEEDAKELLADSPWTKNVHLDQVRNLSMFERRDGGDWEAGIPTGVGLATLGLLADWKQIEAVEHAYALEIIGNVTVRWESAYPVRAAQAKVGESAVPAWMNDYYAIAVHDLHPPLRWNLSNQLRGLAYLRNGKKDLKPVRVVVLPKADGLATIVYLFPRSVEITKKDRNLLFVAQIGRLFISTNFQPAAMRLGGEIQL
jgi:hypothetical protein